MYSEYENLKKIILKKSKIILTIQTTDNLYVYVRHYVHVPLIFSTV